jgi:hypothetical protein
MNCESAQEMILDHEQSADLAAHLAACAGCRELAALDQRLSAAYSAPSPSAAFRTGIHARVRAERLKKHRDALPMLIAPIASLATAGLCAVFVPTLLVLFVNAGVVLAVASCLAHLLFVWLTEELGEV